MSKNDNLVRRLREEIIVDAFADRRIADGKLADRLIRERAEAADAIERGAAQGVRVKPLEWDEPSGHGVDPYFWAICAKIATKGYRIDWVGHGLNHTSHKGPFKLMDVGSFKTIDEAKAAAQADYEQRIISALDLSTPPAPAPDAGEEPNLSDITASLGRRVPSPTPQPPAVEAEAVEDAAEIIWNDLFGVRGGPWDRSSQDVSSINVRATARAALKAKTDEIERLRRERDDARRELCNYYDNLKAAEASNKALRGELNEISAAIGTTRFMDPPDGGDVSLAEQVRRMKAELG